MVNLEYPAHIAFHSLNEADKVVVGNYIEQLDSPHGISRLRDMGLQRPTSNNMYVLRVSPQLRVAIELRNNTTQVIDIFTKHRLDAFRKNKHATH
jgi:hypothetical protein